MATNKENKTTQITVHGGFNSPDKNDRLTVTFYKGSGELKKQKTQYDKVSHASARRLERLLAGNDIFSTYKDYPRTESEIEVSQPIVSLGWYGVNVYYKVLRRPVLDLQAQKYVTKRGQSWIKIYKAEYSQMAGKFYKMELCPRCANKMGLKKHIQLVRANALDVNSCEQCGEPNRYHMYPFEYSNAISAEMEMRAEMGPQAFQAEVKAGAIKRLPISYEDYEATFEYMEELPF